jgi:hypothetical protein
VQRRLSPDRDGHAWRQDERTNEPGDHGQASKNHRYQAFAVCAIGTLAIALVAHASPAAAHSAPRESKSNDVSFVFTGPTDVIPIASGPGCRPLPLMDALASRAGQRPFRRRNS